MVSGRWSLMIISLPSPISVPGPDLVFGGQVVQRVQLPAQFVQLVVDVVHLGAQPLVLPKVGVKLPLVLMSLGVRCYLWVSTRGGEDRKSSSVLDTLFLTRAHQLGVCVVGSIKHEWLQVERESTINTPPEPN